ATAYADQHKIITVRNKTHVVWLDADAAGFHVRGRTLNRDTGDWSEVVTIGQAQDNHGGPSLTVDSKEYLHVVYYPHHQPVRYRRSLRPNDLSAWSAESEFGEGLSYPTMICAPDDTLILTARRGYFDEAGVYVDSQHIEQELWIKRPNEEWKRRSTLIRSRFPRYAQFATTLAWGPDRRTIHLSSRIYETGLDAQAPPRTTVGYLMSADGGETWTTAAGKRIRLPATAETIDVVTPGTGSDGRQYNAGPLAVSSAGVPHLVYTEKHQGRNTLYLATPASGEDWARRDLTAEFPEQLRGWSSDLGMGGGISFSDSGRATVVTVVLNPSEEERGTLKEWGHSSTEVLRLWSDNNFATVSTELLQPANAREPHWLVNVERATGHNHVPLEPGIIFTAGVAGEGLKDLKLENRVLWQPRN
ncbi:MAG TPA: BNR-4 repeat-containing protein, partial [Opitutus sp.]|nr:BNR-4 repeat-containing protein [Opitutus sp.]